MHFNNEHKSVVAVVVTYNRLALLKIALTAIKNQTRQVDKIVIVNNNSTDGTSDWLALQNDLTVINQENSGGAGGFHTGVKYAYQGNADWIWVMDDDVQPKENCLEELLNYSSVSECLNPIHFDSEGTLSDEERWFDPASCKTVSVFNQSYISGKKIWFRNIGWFEGMLISKNIVSKIGFPDKRFFITHDDLAYGYLANKHTNVAVVADAIIQKLPANKSMNSIYSYLYYYHRNLWLLEEYAAADLKNFEGYRKRRITKQFIYSGYKIFRFNEFPNKFKALKVLYRAYKDYKRKKSGKSF